MRVNGTIPEEITIVSSVEQPVYRQWEGEKFIDEIDEEEGEVIKYDERREMVIPAFPIETGNKKTLKTAIEWAENHRQWYDPQTKKHLKKSDPVIQDTRKNEPITGVQVVALEERGNGGRAYKVKTKDKYYFDMREDVMLDTMVTDGIAKGGILNGRFIFGRVGSQMKLVRIGSELHKALLEAVFTNKTKALDKETFQVGDVLENKSGKQKVFCGWISTANFSLSMKVKPNKSQIYTNKTTYVDSFSYNEMPKAMLWLNTWSKFNEKDYRSYVKDAMKTTYHFDVSTTHSLIKKIGNIDDIIPARIIQTIAGRVLSEMTTELHRTSSSSSYYEYEDSNGNKITANNHDKMRCLGSKSKMALMVPLTDKFEIDEDFKKYINLTTK